VSIDIPHSSVISEGHVNSGGVLSLTVIIWIHVAKLLQPSIALHVLVTTVGQVPVSTSEKIRVTLEQSSVAVATPVTDVSIDSLHSTVILGGHEIVGIPSSINVMT
jgi:hypothetical protein